MVRFSSPLRSMAAGPVRLRVVTPPMILAAIPFESRRI